MSAAALYRTMWLAGGLSLLLGFLRENAIREKPLGLRGLQSSGSWAGEFHAGGAYRETASGDLPAHIPTVGSWIGSDEWQGRAETGWFASRAGVVRVCVAGYPQHAGCSLAVEFSDGAGNVTRVRCPLADPREQWVAWEFTPPRGTKSLRLIAEDRAIDYGGWLAFSQPFTPRPSALAREAYMAAQVLATVALALILVWGPGVLWTPRSAAPEIRLAWLIGAGPFMLATMGLGIWLLAGVIRPGALGLQLVTVAWIAIGVRIWRRGLAVSISATQQHMLAVSALLVLAVTAKATYSIGPDGELYRGGISRNLTVGDRTDSRFSFYVAQIAAQHLGPGSAAAERYFSPWTFFSRGPLAGLAALPLVFATQGQPPTDMPEQPWTPFDETGFAAYRIAMVTLASVIVLAMFALLAPMAGETWAAVGAGLLALSPFGVHEVMFTWPKWEATAWLIASFMFAQARRPFAAGLALAAGFFFHPMVLLWAPWIGIWTVVRGTRDMRGLAITAISFAAGLLPLVAGWMALGAITPHLTSTPLPGQVGFMRYIQLADWLPATWETWWRTRWMNFANTFIPFRLHLVDFAHPKMDSVYGPAGSLEKFAVQWWSTWPLGLGLGLWGLSLVTLVAAFRRWRGAVALFVIAPAALIIAYWGATPLGLMRECGHPLFVALLAFTCLALARAPGRAGAFVLRRILPWLQLPETWLMLWLTTLLNHRPVPVEYHALDPFWLTLNTLALIAAAAVLSSVRGHAAAQSNAVNGGIVASELARPAALAAPLARTATVARVIWILAGVALLLGVARNAVLSSLPRPRELPRLDGATGKPWVEGTFTRGGVQQELAAGLLPGHIPTVTSWVGSDEAQGRAETAWFRATRSVIRVGVAGYPQHAGCRLWAEFRAANEVVTRIDCALSNPREEWVVWEIHRPPGATAVRLVAEDRASDYAGWVAFSHPFRAWPGAVRAGYQHLQIFTTTALAFIMIFGPGLWWCPREAAPEMRTAIIIGAGPLAIGALGVIIWIFGPWVRPQTAGLILVTAAWAAIGWRAGRQGFALPGSRAFHRLLAAIALVALAVVAKSFYSVGPPGELFRGSVSRNFEMADRIDSRYSFYVVQAAAHHLAPAAPATEKFFFPWTFFSRGPLAGLVATPLVFATGGEPPADFPDERWTPFDPTGFAAYRITMIALASSAVIALFLMLGPIAGETWALIAAGLVLLSPFGIHEMLFTWPKWPATAWLAASFGLAHARRPLGAGFALAIGFLFHPLVLLWAPWLAGWSAARGERTLNGLTRTLVRFGTGAGVLVLPWMALGALLPHLPTTPLAGQGGFFRYFARADWKIPTWETWWHTRWMNFANTFIPLHGYLADASFNHPKLNSAYEASGRLVKFSQLWWNSLPFALGLGLWGVSMAAIVRAARPLLALVLLFVIAPALFITAYWGMDPLGLMRECGHPLFIAIVAITCVVAAQQGGWLARVLTHRSIPWLQLPETWLMLWMTSLLNTQPPATDFNQLDGVAFAINGLALLLAAWVLSHERIPAQSHPAPPRLVLPTPA